MEIIDSESGQIICSSCSQYGNSTSHGETMVLPTLSER